MKTPDKTPGLPENWTHAEDFIKPFLAKCIREGVSDIHLERIESEGVIRVRKDGLMREWVRMHMDKMTLVLSKLKFISGLDPMLHGHLQQARFEYRHGEKTIDMRVSVLPTPRMDDMVIRILGSSPEVMKLKDMGLRDYILTPFRRAINADQGLILVTGPTGSGKTTTLYAAVDEIKDGSLKIITVEDPIEYQVEGLTQVKLNASKKLNYADILRTILRHDPDAILIGEIRDLEAAEIAIESAMTGHLVLSTLHTNSAAATILRLINMGISPMDVVNSVTMLYAQRLMRKLCPNCKVAVPVPDEMKAYMQKYMPETPLPDHVYAPKGCEECDHTGYKGRAPIGEVILMEDALRDVILKEASLTALNRYIETARIKTLKYNGTLLCLEGLVPFSDVINVTGG